MTKNEWESAFERRQKIPALSFGGCILQTAGFRSFPKPSMDFRSGLSKAASQSDILLAALSQGCLGSLPRWRTHGWHLAFWCWVAHVPPEWDLPVDRVFFPLHASPLRLNTELMRLTKCSSVVSSAQRTFFQMFCGLLICIWWISTSLVDDFVFCSHLPSSPLCLKQQ